jgi:hypothetical protein
VSVDDRNLRTWKLIRDVIIVAVAIFVVVHETLDENPSQLLLAAALVMLGLPAALRIDEHLKRNGGGR